MRETNADKGVLADGSAAKKNEAWNLEPHICRKCFGRLVSRVVPGSVPGAELRVYQCTNCGAEAQHTNADAICCCGIKIKRAGRNGTKASSTLVDAGVRCIPNPEISPMFPSQYVASEVVRK